MNDIAKGCALVDADIQDVAKGMRDMKALEKIFLYCLIKERKSTPTILWGLKILNSTILKENMEQEVLLMSICDCEDDRFTKLIIGF